MHLCENSIDFSHGREDANCLGMIAVFSKAQTLELVHPSLRAGAVSLVLPRKDLSLHTEAMIQRAPTPTMLLALRYSVADHGNGEPGLFDGDRARHVPRTLRRRLDLGARTCPRLLLQLRRRLRNQVQHLVHAQLLGHTGPDSVSGFVSRATGSCTPTTSFIPVRVKCSNTHVLFGPGVGPLFKCLLGLCRGPGDLHRPAKALVRATRESFLKR